MMMQPSIRRAGAALLHLRCCIAQSRIYASSSSEAVRGFLGCHGRKLFRHPSPGQHVNVWACCSAAQGEAAYWWRIQRLDL